VIAVVAWTSVYFIGGFIYNIFFHPLRNFPGPIPSRATAAWKVWKMLNGELAHYVKDLHDIYGPIVRVAPNELSFVESQAWKDIYGHHGGYEMAKDMNFYRPMGEHVPEHIVSSSRASHSMLRRQLAHGFSERAMREQEPIIGEYVDLLMRRLEEHSDDGTKSVDMRAWFNFATFDIIGNLGFGSDFGCLENSYYHPWVAAIGENIKNLATLQAIYYALPRSWLVAVTKSGLMKGRRKHLDFTQEKVKQRMSLGEERSDFIEGILHKKDELSMGEIVMNAQVIILAGSETTATLLSGALFCIASNPDVLGKLVKEVRSSFSSESEITLTSVNNLTYMLACLNESLRMYPPVPVSLPRVVPNGGHTIAGRFVPEKTTVGVSHFAAYHSKTNFADPEGFHPSRFMGDEKFASDDLASLQPFSVGPRNCIGRNLAYAEMRLIMARLLFKFDIELAPREQSWLEQKAYMIWDKPELPFYLKLASQ
jgi:cytochrome P450